MSLIAIQYALGVLEGRAAGVDVEVRDVPARAMEVVGRQGMDRRIRGLMTDVARALKVYARLQFETSGNAMAKISAQIGSGGGSSEPWAPLTEGTLIARARGRGYYGMTRGSSRLKESRAEEVEFSGGEDPHMALEAKEAVAASRPGNVKPRLWTGRGMKIAMDAVRGQDRSVNVRITETTMRYNEATRPVFVIEEVHRMVQRLAEKAFANMRRVYDSSRDQVFKEAAVSPGEEPFSMRVGESRPMARDRKSVV